MQSIARATVCTEDDSIGVNAATPRPRGGPAVHVDRRLTVVLHLLYIPCLAQYERFPSGSGSQDRRAKGANASRPFTCGDREAVAKAVEEVLAAWREAERVLDTLPPLSPDHETVRRTVVSLRRTYQTITSDAEQTAETIDRTHQTIGAAREVLTRVAGTSRDAGA
jgi:hypothetical protein